MNAVELFISCGSDMNRYRDYGKDVIERLNHMLRREMDIPFVIENWDFRRDAPRVVPRGELSARSLQMVEKSQALIAIFGRRCPVITREEIRRAFELRRDGHNVDVFVFTREGALTDGHRNFLEGIKDDFDEEIVWTPFSGPLDFQAHLFVTLTPFLLDKVGGATVPLLGGR